ncbi:MAG: hypothetical protein WEC15_04855 [Flavobacteriales bacterium]
MAHAQDNQYWTQQYGARATLMGGAASASTEDQAAFFYNPAAARRVLGTGVTASANFFYGQRIRMTDQNDLGVGTLDSQTDVAPRLLVGAVNAGPDDRWRISFGYVSNVYGRMEVAQSASYARDLDRDRPGTEFTTTLLNVLATSREDLIGLGASRTVGEKGSIGASLFGSSYSQSFVQLLDMGVYGDPALNDTVPVLASYSGSERVDLYNFGFLAKLGYFHKGERTQWGLTLALPRLSTQFLSGGDLNRTVSTFRVDGPLVKSVQSGTQLPTAIHSPWMLDLGVETRIGSSVWAFRVAYASAVQDYDRMRLDDGTDLVGGALPPSMGSTRRVRSASIPIVNGAIGAQFHLSPIADLLVGVRTDLNHLDRSGFDSSTDLSATFSYWDLYHVSCGVALHSTRIKLTTGLVYAFGSSGNALDEFYRAGALENGLRDVRFQTRYDQLGLTLGFSYFILGKEGTPMP